VVIDEAVVEGETQPILIFENSDKPKKAADS